MTTCFQLKFDTSSMYWAEMISMHTVSAQVEVFKTCFHFFEKRDILKKVVFKVEVVKRKSEKNKKSHMAFP